ncbi:hypothetical protein [Microbacterium excoecariae]|uniref:hypothetical protein n=1 Tax=Microbacterium excoecariae TaxID=2715210 RepID=UPI00140AD9BE|nr:hypothetical protein [Microbacterium excoecariae]NHI15974.1 hypothetical protein [Microbacterium excoecariae]
MAGARAERLPWGRALWFASVAIGAPWAVVTALTTILTVSDSGRWPWTASALAAAPAMAAAAVIAAALWARHRPPLSRTDAGLIAMVSSYASLVALALALAIAEARNGAQAALVIVAYALPTALGVFTAAAGPVWAWVGGVAAASLAGVRETPVRRRVGALWAGAGMLLAAAAVVLALAPPLPCEPPPSGGMAAPARLVWRWLPLGWGCDSGFPADPAPFATLLLSLGLAVCACGLALLLRPRPARAPARERFLFE